MGVLLWMYESRGAQLLARVGVPPVPVGQPLSPSRRAAELLATQFGTVAAAPEGCGAPATRGVLPSGVWR
jgi:hypothetical protein